MYLPNSSVAEISFPALVDPNAGQQLALQYQFEQSQWMSQEGIWLLQSKQLQALLLHASQHVPYYRSLFNESKYKVPVKSKKIRLQDIPISLRAGIQKAGDELISKSIPASHGNYKLSSTSGSTGQPVHFAKSPLTHVFWLAFGLREHLWHNRGFMKKLGAIRWFPRGQAEAPAGSRAENWGPIAAPVFPSGPSAVLNVTASLQEQYDWLRREKPDYLVSFPSNLKSLTRFIVDQKLTFPKILQLRTIGETLDPQTKTYLNNAWKTKIVDIYSCEEAGYLAIQCPENDVYHVQSENIILEIVDDEGQPCPPGVEGRVLITTLHNFVTPLIRYELGDIAEFGEACSCGRGLPVISKILGRKRNRLILPSGENRFPYLGEHGGIASLTGVDVKQIQVIQHSVEDIEVKLVLSEPLDAEGQQKVMELMQRNLGYPFSIRLSFPEVIEPGPNGKFEEFMSLVELIRN